LIRCRICRRVPPMVHGPTGWIPDLSNWRELPAGCWICRCCSLAYDLGAQTTDAAWRRQVEILN